MVVLIQCYLLQKLVMKYYQDSLKLEFKLEHMIHYMMRVLDCYKD